jgi:16S rRNA (cytidine1402-2'-O)-methyltransferase
MNQTGKLYIVATPIGNPEDITLRALRILRSVDCIICEEYKQGSKLLKKLEVEYQTLLCVNEHNESEQASEIANRLLMGENFALISDCGTPVFSDPGYHVIRKAAEYDIPVIPIPGVSSLTTAISVLDFKLTEYVFGGFLPRDKDERQKALYRLRGFQMPVILMDTPYRLVKLLGEVANVFGKPQKITLACNLTQADEKIYRGSVGSVTKQVGQMKAEFMLIIHAPSDHKNSSRGRRK